MKKKLQFLSLILLTMLFENKMLSQNFTGDFNSINFKNDGKSILFRVKNITINEFNLLFLKAKDNNFFVVNDFKGYSEKDKIGTFYLNSLTNKTLFDLQNFCLYLNIKTLIFDGETIATNTLNDQKINKIERSMDFKKNQLK